MDQEKGIIVPNGPDDFDIEPADEDEIEEGQTEPDDQEFPEGKPEPPRPTGFPPEE